MVISSKIRVISTVYIQQFQGIVTRDRTTPQISRNESIMYVSQMYMKASEAEHCTIHSISPIPFILNDGKTDTYEIQTIKVQIPDEVAEKCVIFTGVVNPRSV